MSNTANEWTLDGFVDHFDFVHHKMLDHKYVWVLGAGASYASGIPLGSQLVDEWLKEIHLREDGGQTPLKEWATAEELDIKNFEFDDRASFYPRIYQRRFREYPDEGYAYLESVMSGKDPSPGYSILASALAEDPPRHNVVITTNFDNLVADALSIYTDTFPFVAGHESLTSFVRVSMRRPLICKIHRDLLLGPQNDPRSLKRLHDAWGTALRALFQHYTPLFIGYGGNDDTLMDLLESLQPSDVKGQLIWCYYEKAKPSERIASMVSDLNGVLVPVPDFDLLMVLLGEKKGISLLDEEIGRRAAERTQRYRDRIQALDTVGYPSVTQALAATLERSGGWWAWDQKARGESDPKRSEVVYRQGIRLYPLSSELHHNLGVFLQRLGGRDDEVEKLFLTAIKLSPKDADYRSTLANFLSSVRKQYDEAEDLYRKTIEIDPKNARNIGNFASFMWRVRRNYIEAENLYRKAHDLDNENVRITFSFASFTWTVLEKNAEAEALYQKALKLDPSNAPGSGSFATFLWQEGRYEEAEEMYNTALKLDSKNWFNLGNYGGFLLARGRVEDAREAIEAAKLNYVDDDQMRAELMLYTAIIACVKGENHEAAINELETLLSHGFLRSRWSFSEVLAFARERISPSDYAAFSALAKRILASDQVLDADVVGEREVT